MTTPSHPHHDDPVEIEPRSRRTTAYIVAGIAALIATLVVLHLTGVIGG
jgi:predicted nucleic acid-binding Zn ribbon protein